MFFRVKIARFLLLLLRWRWLPAATRGARVVRMLEDMGLFFVKIGQIMSVQYNMLPQAITDELRRLQSAVAPGPTAVDVRDLALRGVVIEAGAAPFACGSVSCVFRGTYRGHDVAVKVVRASAKSDIASTRQCMREAKWLVSWVPYRIVHKMARFLAVVIDIMEAQIDLRNEVENWRRMHAAHGDAIVVPFVYEEVCDKDVLVMDYVDGHSVEDMRRIVAAAPDPGAMYERVCDEMSTFMFDSALITRVYHADMHPGNVFWRKSDGRLGLYDYGIVNEIDPELARKIMCFYIHLFAGNVEDMGASLAKLVYDENDLRPQLEESITAALRERLGAAATGVQLVRHIQDIVVAADARLNHDVTLININMLMLDNIMNRLGDEGYDAIATVKRHIMHHVVEGTIDIDAVLAS